MKMTIMLSTFIAGTLCLTTSVAWAQSASAAPAAKAVQPGPLQIIPERIKAELSARLTEAGAACESLDVTVAARQDRATPFKVTYRGLRNFTGTDGSVPPADGAFIMKYAGAGQWQGALAGKLLTANVGATDNIDVMFFDDPQVIGEWESVDFVDAPTSFNPAQKTWKGRLFLKELTFLAGGKTAKPWWTWTKGYLLHSGDKTASHYEIREISGVRYLFLEWKSGDVTISGMKPHYYVLKPKAAKGSS
jgi:hypothetical protein